MNNYTYQNTNQKRPRISVNEQKNRALRYLKEALQNEAYEICEKHLKTARIYGASDFEIEYILFDALQETEKGANRTQTSPRF